MLAFALTQGTRSGTPVGSLSLSLERSDWLGAKSRPTAIFHLCILPTPSVSLPLVAVRVALLGISLDLQTQVVLLLSADLVSDEQLHMTLPFLAAHAHVAWP